MFDSKKYWEERYVSKMTSGAGSYNELAQFKADVINKFVEHNNIQSVIEYGCGDGNQLKYMKYPLYKGLDVSPTIINVCKDIFQTDNTKTFEVIGDKYINKFDLAVSLDVLFHCTEQDVYEEYLHDLFNASNKYVIIYAYDYDSLPGEFTVHYIPRKFTSYITKNISHFILKDVILNKYPVSEFGTQKGSYSNFYIFEKL
jgi:cyclopropane fatty-acyl-phospholipid synthase-like methyltransferase